MENTIPRSFQVLWTPWMQYTHTPHTHAHISHPLPHEGTYLSGFTVLPSAPNFVPFLPVTSQQFGEQQVGVIPFLGTQRSFPASLPSVPGADSH